MTSVKIRGSSLHVYWEGSLQREERKEGREEKEGVEDRGEEEGKISGNLSNLLVSYFTETGSVHQPSTETRSVWYPHINTSDCLGKQ